ncbi:MAG TPA: hypothetical protein VHB98_14745, partial [Chloroflexota bacterium]|nr:hypothetical protein [Chloroflexota bacterium]
TTLLVLDPAAHRLLAYGNPTWNMPGPQPSSQVQTIDTQKLALLATVEVGPVYYPGDFSPSNEASPHPVAIDEQAGVAIALSVSSDQYTTGQLSPGMASLISVRGGQLLRQVPVGIEPCAVAVDSRLHRAYIANRGDGTVTVLDTRTGALVARVRAGAGADPVSIGVDDRAGTVFVAGPAAENGPAGAGAGVLTMFDAAITGNHA